jgi:hypothetical protein
MSDGYESVFNNCKIISNNSNDDYTNFREKSEFEFLVNNEPEPDEETYDITICAHSLSEISKENFDIYLLNKYQKKILIFIY